MSWGGQWHDRSTTTTKYFTEQHCWGDDFTLTEDLNGFNTMECRRPPHVYLLPSLTRLLPGCILGRKYFSFLGIWCRMIVDDFISYLMQKSAFFQIFDLNGFNTRGTMYQCPHFWKLSESFMKSEQSAKVYEKKIHPVYIFKISFPLPAARWKFRQKMW